MFIQSVNQSINLFSNKGPKGLLQVATKYNITLTQYLCVLRIPAYIHIHTRTYCVSKNVMSNFSRIAARFSAHLYTEYWVLIYVCACLLSVTCWPTYIIIFQPCKQK